MIERIAIILLINIVFFAKTITYKYSSDDIPASRRKKEPTKLRQLFWSLEGRARINPQVDHFITTILHALTCVFIYTGFGCNEISFLAALLFSFNPANNQGSVWISGRSYVWPALCMTLAMSIPFIAPLALMITTYYNAGFIAPIALLGSEHAWMIAFLPLCWFIHWKKFKGNVVAKAKMEMFDEDKKIHPKKLILATKTFGFYFVHALIPIKNTFYHAFLQSLAGSLGYRGYTLCRYFWIGSVALAGIATYFFTQPWGMIHFGLLWWCIGIAPFLNLVRIHQEIAERYMYVPNVGLMVVLASILHGYPVAFAVFMTMYMTKLWFYMDAYQDDYYLVEQSTMNAPDAWFAWHVRAMKRWDCGARQEAIFLWVMAKMISPNEFKILFNLAAALCVCNNSKEGMHFLSLAEKNIPKGQEKRSNELIAEFRKGNVTILL